MECLWNFLPDVFSVSSRVFLVLRTMGQCPWGLYESSGYFHCIGMHCSMQFSLFITAMKGSSVGFHCIKVYDAWASTFEAWASFPCIPLVINWLGWSGGPFISVNSLMSGVYWWLLLWSSVRSTLGALAVISVGLPAPLVIGTVLALGLHIVDSSCVGGESAMTSAGASDASDPDSSLLDTGRGMDRKLRVLTWDLPLRQLKAVSL